MTVRNGRALVHARSPVVVLWVFAHACLLSVVPVASRNVSAERSIGVSACWAITFSNVVLNDPVDASWAVSRVAVHSIECWERGSAHAIVVDEFSVVASRLYCARVGEGVPVRKINVVAHASLVGIVPHSTFTVIDCLAEAKHVVVRVVVTNANV
jgi:hypothetical protein